MSNNFPSIGEIVLDPSDKFKENHADSFDLLDTDGGGVDPITHPILHSKLNPTLHNEKLITTLPDSNIQAICWTGSFYYVYSNPIDRVYQYSPTFVKTGVSWVPSVGLASTVRGIAWDGTDLVLTRAIPGAPTLQRYTESGLLKTTVSIDDNITPSGIFYKEGMFYVTSSSSAHVYMFDTLLEQVGGGMPVEGGSLQDLAFTAGAWVIAENVGDRLLVYSEDLSTMLSEYTPISTSIRGVCPREDRFESADSVLNRVYSYDLGKITPNIPPKTPETPYKIVADLTGN